jgi:adenosylhomocysteine nucleosidase
MIALIIALPEEAEGIDFNRTYISGVGKVNSMIATFKAIRDGATGILNYGSAGLVSKKDLHNQLIQPDILIQRDMFTEPQAPRGVTPFEEGDYAGAIDLGTGTNVTLGSGDSFVQEPDPWFEYASVDIVDMEAYGIAKTCRKVGNVTFKCFKWVSDFADENAMEHWRKNLANGNSAMNEIMKGYK